MSRHLKITGNGERNKNLKKFIKKHNWRYKGSKNTLNGACNEDEKERNIETDIKKQNWRKKKEC